VAVRTLAAMTLAEVIETAMALTPEERSRVADVLSDVDDTDTTAIDTAWAAVAARRADELDSGAIVGLTREELKAYLAERRAARAA
ncbi:MAG: addiction module protein, partial [Leucobacter sp.]